MRLKLLWFFVAIASVGSSMLVMYLGLTDVSKLTETFVKQEPLMVVVPFFEIVASIFLVYLFLKFIISIGKRVFKR